MPENVKYHSDIYQTHPKSRTDYNNNFRIGYHLTQQKKKRLLNFKCLGFYLWVLMDENYATVVSTSEYSGSSLCIYV